MRASISGRSAVRASRAAGPTPAAVHAAPCVRPHCVAAPAAAAPSAVAAAPAAAPRRCMQHARRGNSTRTAASSPAADAMGKDIQITTSELSATERRATITIPAAVCQEGFKRTVENLKKIVGKLPGFRDDKIPLSMLVTQCGGQQKFKYTVMEEIMLSTITPAIDSTGENTIPDSVKILTDIRDMEAAFDPAKPFAYDVKYEVAPPLRWKASYKGLEVTIQDNGNLDTDNKTVDKLIRSYLKEKGFQRVVVGRGLQVGDACVMDLTVCPKGSSQPLTGMRRDKFPMDTDVDPIGLVQQMVGMQPGEARSFGLTIPSDYTVEPWRNMAVDVKVKVHEIFNWVTPEFNDEFVAAHYASSFSSAEEMRKGLLTAAAMDRVKELDGQLEDKLAEAVVSRLDMVVPPSLVNEMGATQYRNMLMQMLQKGTASRQELEDMLTEEAIDEYIANNRKDLEDMVKFNTAVDAIFQAENLIIDEADIKAEMQSQEETYKAQGLEYDAAVLREGVVDSFKSVKVIEWLKDNAKRNTLPYQG